MGQPVSQLRFKFTRAMVTGLDTISARRIQVHSLMPEVLSARRAGFRKITISNVSARLRGVSLREWMPTFAGSW